MADVVNTTKTFEQMRDEVLFMTSSRTGALFPEAQVKAAINNGLSIVWGMTHDDMLEISNTLEIGQREYELPDVKTVGYDAIVDVVEIGGEEITEATEYPTYDATNTGTPDSYYINGRVLVLDPIPDAEVEIRVVYRHEFVPLSDNADTADMTDNEVHAAILYACYLMKMKDEQYTAASMFLNQHQDVLALASKMTPGIYRMDADGDVFGGAV